MQSICIGVPSHVRVISQQSLGSCTQCWFVAVARHQRWTVNLMFLTAFIVFTLDVPLELGADCCGFNGIDLTSTTTERFEPADSLVMRGPDSRSNVVGGSLRNSTDLCVLYWETSSSGGIGGMSWYGSIPRMSVIQMSIQL